MKLYIANVSGSENAEGPLYVSTHGLLEAPCPPQPWLETTIGLHKSAIFFHLISARIFVQL